MDGGVINISPRNDFQMIFLLDESDQLKAFIFMNGQLTLGVNIDMYAKKQN